MRLQSYLNLIDFNADGIGVPFHVDIANSLWHNSLEYSRPLGARQTFVLGVEFRRDAFTGNVTRNQRKRLDQYSLYLQDAIALLPKVTITLGGRIDHKPRTTTEIPLRAALVFSPSATQSFRLTAAQGFRSPSLVEYFVVSQFGPAQVLGSTALKPERAAALEAGYRGLWGNEKILLGLDFFLEALSGFIFFDQRDLTTISFVNGGKSTNTGGEAEVGLLLPHAWRVQATYAYEKISDQSSYLGFENSVPRSRAAFGVHRNPSAGIFFNLWAYTSGKTTWPFSYVSLPPVPLQVRMPSYFLVNTYAGYAFSPKVRAGISILNLTNTQRAQFPFGEKQPRTLWGGLEASF
ncbi:MAG: TonB-dependent receptor [candidate division KSB1 bacterium]|nr:TonB-dependent receptor [candidate division KSB1 bacterium]MDZ7274089.1 TonB-dependent receptor [candidate division KSB1 bacterium]MDZ7287866.1 TonB-dependent receptor [candidate division KSB1 bacterium]MDZ7296688.1 TonB-dependent receptor [candidate division KSB1 bacterium]MDZ7306942.1 TonB-dependent receptor [candidate division KSB1 bacterium]